MPNKHTVDLIEKSVIGLFVFLYSLAASLISLNRYWQFNAFWYDFGILDETIWKLSRFRLPIVPSLKPPLGLNNWGDHFNPSVAFLSPLYWLTGKQEIILIAQVVAVALSALVFYAIARKMIVSRLVRIALAVSYLGFVGTQNALFTDIHNIVYALLPLSLVFWAVFNSKWKLYWVFLLIFLGFQENLAAVGIGLGLYLLLRPQRQVRVGVLTILVSLIYVLVATKMVIPFFAGHAYNYQPQYPKVTSDWFWGFFLPADMKLKTIIFSLATFGFLPLISISTWPLIFEHFLERFVLNTAATRWDLGFHYNALLAAILVVADIEAIVQLQKKKIPAKLLPAWAVITIILVFFFHRFILHGPLLMATNPDFYKGTADTKFLRDFAAHIPKDDLVMAPNNIAAHLTHQDVTLLDKNYVHVNPKWIVLDTRLGQNANNYYLLNPGEFAFLTASVSADFRYKVYYQSGDQTIYERQP